MSAQDHRRASLPILGAQSPPRPLAVDGDYNWQHQPRMGSVQVPHSELRQSAHFGEPGNASAWAHGYVGWLSVDVDAG